MSNFISDWYNAYPSLWVFTYHKLTHIAVGAAIGAIGYAVDHTYIGLGLVLFVAVGKEIADHRASFDRQSNSYQYDAPLSWHALDVIVTFLGGLSGVLIASLL